MKKKGTITFTPEEALAYHENNFPFHGKIESISKTPVRTFKDLTLAYTPGVAIPCKVIEKEPEKVFQYTNKGNTVAVVTDGTAVLGLGDIGPEAGLPVMEGKCVLFKSMAGVDAVPVCLNTKDPQKIIEITKAIEPTYGGINLEDIAAPACFEVENALKKEMNIPVFHDDQHGTAVVMLAGLINALKVVGKKRSDIKVAMNGAGAAGIAGTKFMLDYGIKDITLCDSRGCLHLGRDDMNPFKEDIAKVTNPECIETGLRDAMKGADVFLGLSVGGQVDKDMVKSMNDDAIVFAMANPTPEIMPEDALESGAAVIATGRSDFPNQINNVLGFPGIFRGALDVMASDVNEPMKIAAAEAIASCILEDELEPEYIIGTPIDPTIMPAEAEAVARAAIDSGVARKPNVPKGWVAENTRKLATFNREFIDPICDHRKN